MTSHRDRHRSDAWAGLPRGAPARVALIGVSGYARVHFNLLREAQARGAVRLVAATIINPEEEATVVAELRAGGCQIFGDYRAMLAAHRGTLDLCCIPTGIAWHAVMTIAALESGANVLVEKPLAGSLADVHAICAAERATGRFVAVGFQNIYAPETVWLKEQLLAGVVGPLLTIRFAGQWPRTTAYYTRNDWAGRLHAGGAAVYDSPLNNAFAHFAHLGLWLAGPGRTTAAAPVAVEAELWRSHAIESCDTTIVRARLSTGSQLLCAATHSSPILRDPEIAIEGTRGWVHWYYERECVLNNGTKDNIVRPLPSAMDCRRLMFAAVLRRLRHPEVEICDTASAAQHTALIAAMHAAAQIQTIPAARIEWVYRPGEPAAVPTVAGLEESLATAWAGHRPVGHAKGGGPPSALTPPAPITPLQSVPSPLKPTAS
jgi:predicted dehydrogenase